MTIEFYVFAVKGEQVLFSKMTADDAYLPEVGEGLEVDPESFDAGEWDDWQDSGLFPNDMEDILLDVGIDDGGDE